MDKYFKKLFILFALISFDQLSKYIIRMKGGFYICNNGIAFGIKLYPIIFYIIWIVIILFLIAALYKKIFSCDFCTIVILSGAISNIIDRLNFGCVIDFIDLKFWPIFNLADIYITIGVMLILLSIFKNNKKT